jgi:hypothetical protein
LRPWSNTSPRPGNSRPTLLPMLALIGFGMLSAGCPKRNVLPDSSQVHQLSADADLEVWCHGPDSAVWTKCKIRASKGWWLAPPSVVEAEK